MGWSDMALQGGLDLLKTGMAYSAAKDKAKSDRAWQAYNNAMVNIQNGQNQNTINTNENLAAEKKQEADFAITKSDYITAASAENAAATTGTIGRSVNAVLLQVHNNAGEAKSRNENDWENQQANFNSQRLQSALQTQMQQDMRYIPDPSPATYMLGFASDMTKAYTADQRGTRTR